MNYILSILFFVQTLTIYSQEYKYSLYELGKGEILPSEYRFLGNLGQNYFSATQCDPLMKDYSLADKTGIIDASGRVILPFIYRNIVGINDSLIQVSNGKGRALCAFYPNHYPPLIQKTDFEYLSFGTKILKKNAIDGYNGFYKLLDLTHNRILLDTKFVEILELTTNLMATKDMNYQWGIVTFNGKIVLNNQYNKIGLLNSDLIYIKKGNKVGVIDSEGSVIIPIDYKNVAVEDNMIFAQHDKNTDVLVLKSDSSSQNHTSTNTLSISEDGVNIIELTSSDDNEISSAGLAGVFDLKGNVIIPFEYDGLNSDKNGYIIAHKNSKWGVIGHNAKTIIFPKFQMIKSQFKGFYTVQYSNKWSILDSAGNEITPFQFDNIFITSPHTAFAKLNQKWYSISFNRNIILNSVPLSIQSTYKFDYFEEYDSKSGTWKKIFNMIKADDGNSIGIIRPDGEILIHPAYKYISSFENGNYFEAIDFEKHSHFFNAQGQSLSDTPYDDYNRSDSFNKKTIICSINEKFGVINQHGHIEIPFIYHWIERVSGSEKLFIVVK